MIISCGGNYLIVPGSAKDVFLQNVLVVNFFVIQSYWSLAISSFSVVNGFFQLSMDTFNTFSVIPPKATILLSCY